MKPVIKEGLFKYRCLKKCIFTNKWGSNKRSNTLEKENQTKRISQLFQAQQVHQNNWSETDVCS